MQEGLPCVLEMFQGAARHNVPTLTVPEGDDIVVRELTPSGKVVSQQEALDVKHPLPKPQKINEKNSHQSIPGASNDTLPSSEPSDGYPMHQFSNKSVPDSQ